jgi:hypothetical protein
MLKSLILASCLSTPIVYAECEKMSRPKYDGGLMVFEEKTDSIRIYDGEYKPTLTDDDILWEWRIKESKDRDFRARFSKTKNDAKPILYKGRLAILLSSSRGDGVSILDFDTRRIVYHRRVLGSAHSAAMTPRDNIVLADSKGFVRILSTITGKTAQCPHSSAHGVVWDKRQKLMWGWGNNGRMTGYPIKGTASSPYLDCRNSVKFMNGPGGGHDLQPMLDGNNMLMGSSGPNIFFFEPMVDWPGNRFGFIQRYPGARGIKGVSRNLETGEIVYVRNDRSNGFKYRSNVIRSLDGRNRTVSGGSAFYKVRFFQPNCFSF